MLFTCCLALFGPVDLCFNGCEAREVMKEMQKGEEVEREEEEDDEDLASSVERWMKEQDEKIGKEALRDFNMKVRWQGHVNSLPADHLGLGTCMDMLGREGLFGRRFNAQVSVERLGAPGCILKILFKEASASCDLTSKLQRPVLSISFPVIRPLFHKDKCFEEAK